MTGRAVASQRWRDPAWLTEAAGWATHQLERRHHRVVAPPEQTHVRPWSTVSRIATHDGTFWFKANAIGTAHEARLLDALARLAPAHVLHPLATDFERGWLLLPDGGTTLRAAQDGHTDVAHWAEILTDHAELQRRAAPRAEDLVALGVPDVRPARLPEIRDDLLDDDTALRLGRPDGMSPEQRERMRAAADRYAALCADLDATGIPASVNHDDLHDNNVFAPDHAGGRYRVFDWGDASVAHPFAVLLIALRVVGDLHHLAAGDPDLLRLRDAYLEPWTAEFDRATLREACRLALRVGGVSRALSYRSALLEAGPDEHDEFGKGVPGWLLELDGETPVEPAG